MSSLITLFTSSAGELFEKHLISDIKEMHNDLEKEVNKKTDELRVLVGEKYRDFVEISDKIDKMNHLAENITNGINLISSDFTAFNNATTYNHLFKNELSVDDKRNTIANLNKLLIDIENQIWIELERCHYIVATTLLQLAAHIRTVLTLETSWQINKKFPVFHITWSSILRFPVVISRLTEDKLKSDDLSPVVRYFLPYLPDNICTVYLHETEVQGGQYPKMDPNTACQCLCSITILQNLNSVDVIKRFLTLRMEALEYILSNENSTQKVRARILSSFQIIVSTIEILYYCFHKLSDDNVGEYWKNVTSLTAPECKPALSSVNIDNTAKYGEIYVPTVVQNFRIKSKKPIITLNASEYSYHINDWLQNVRKRTAVQISALLDLIGSLQTLNLIKQSVFPVRRDWIFIAEHFDLKRDLNVWQEMYAPLITERAKTLLSQRWNALFARVCHKIETCMQELSENERREAEDDLHCFLWNSFEDDFVEKSSLNNKLLHPKGLAVKSFGLSPNAGKLCTFLEVLVSTMTNELANICSAKEVESKESIILKEHQQHCCVMFIERLISFVQELVDVDATSENVLLFLARFLNGISLFCESLKQCILLPDEKGDNWHRISSKLNEASLNVWEKWSSTKVSVILKEFIYSISHDISLSTFRIQYFPKWGSFKIIEKTEEDIEVNSEVHVPLQSSFPIQNVLNSFVSLVGHTFPPRIVILKMTNDVLSNIFDFFENLEKRQLHQVIYIQFLFDAKYLNALLIPVESETLIARSSKIISNLEMKIDPVDFDVISSRLSQNVGQFVLKTQDIFGLLVTDKPRMTVEHFVENTDNPLVTEVGAQNVLWFSLLPVSAIVDPTTKQDS